MSKNIHSLDSIKGKAPPRRPAEPPNGGNNRSTGRPVLDGSSDDESSGDEGRQGFYVGGSDRSGQQVLGPPAGGDLASRLFEAAQRAGAETITPEEAAAMAGGSSRPTAYQGGTFRLGGHGQPSQPVVSQTPAGGAGGNSVRIHLRMYPNGFTINDGPLRDPTEQENRAFIADIMNGRTPAELSQLYPGRKIDLQLERKMEEYKAPKAQPFSGQGHRLGSKVPTVVGEGSADIVDLEPPAEFAAGQELKKLVEKAQEAVKLAEGEPVVRVQIRLPNAEPIVARFNNNHTVMDLRAFIVTAQPVLAYSTFQLMTAYPSEVIGDDSKTLKEAGLANAVAIVKIT